MIKQKQGFTLVELIVVTMIVIILGTTGFITLTSYLVTVRDSTRIVEIENIGSALDSYVLKKGAYPMPTDSVNIYYSGGLVWTQGSFGNNIASIIGYSNDTLDPLTKTPYTYSVKNSKGEFSIAGVLEENPGLITFDDGLIESSYAGIQEGTAIVGGNYNGELLSVKADGTNYILALPSIVSSDLSSTGLLDILNNNKLVIDDFGNLPASYLGTTYNIDSNLNFSATQLVIFSGSISKLKQSYNQIGLLQNIYNAYSGSILGKELSINKIDPVDLFSPEPSTEISTFACDMINFKLKYFVECGGIDFITFFVVNVLHIDISNLPGNNISAVYQAEDGSFVFGTDAGVAFHDGTNWVTYTAQNSDLVHNQVSTVSQDNNGDYWIGTNNGISKLTIGDITTTSDDVWVTYGNDVLVGTHIQYIYTDEGGTVWIGTNKGVTSYNGDIWADYTKKTDGLTHNNITAIYTDSNNDVWFGTNSKGVDRYDIISGNVYNYNSGKLPYHKVTYIFEDNSSRMWIGTQSGIGRSSDYGSSWTTFTSSNTSGGLLNNYITYLYEDSIGNIWVGTQGGVSKYDTGNNWTNYNTGDGLLGNTIHSIYEDESSNILIFSDGGLDTIDSGGNIITS